MFNENIPLRNLPPVSNTVTGAMAIQQVLERAEWVQQSGNPVSYAPYITLRPLPGNVAKPVIVQVAKGAQAVYAYGTAWGVQRYCQIIKVILIGCACRARGGQQLAIAWEGIRHHIHGSEGSAQKTGEEKACD